MPPPSVIRAMVTMGQGDLDQMVMRTDCSRPDPASGEVLVRLGACGLNNAAVDTRSGWYSKAVTEATTGGLSRARRVRDFLVGNRIPVVCEDMWRGKIASSVVAQFAASTPPDYPQNIADLMNYNTRATATGGPVAQDGQPYAPDTPGQGVRASCANLDDSVAEYAE